MVPQKAPAVSAAQEHKVPETKLETSTPTVNPNKMEQEQQPNSNANPAPAVQKKTPAPNSARVQRQRQLEQERLRKARLGGIEVDGKKYEPGKKLGKGAEGEVRPLKPSNHNGPPLALKLGKEVEKEAQMLQKAQTHPNVVKGGQLVETTRGKGMVMEHLGGGNLEQAQKDLRAMKDTKAQKGEIRREQYLGTQQHLTQQMLDGVDHVHSKSGLQHNDIKPDNIMLSSNGQAKLVDFGMATQKNAPKAVPGSPAYRAPETRESGFSGPKSDVYALGQTVQFLAKGEQPKPYTPASPKEPKDQKDDSKILEVKRNRNDFVQKTTHPDPDQRLTLEQAKAHPYVTKPLIPEDEAQGVLQKMIQKRNDNSNSN
jgi:serine/threonine protein kinase